MHFINRPFCFLLIVLLCKYLTAATTEKWTHYSFGVKIQHPDGRIVQDGDFIWLGTGKHLIKMYKKTGDTVIVSPQSLYPLGIGGINPFLKDSHGAIWLGVFPAGVGGVLKFMDNTYTIVDTFRYAMPVCMMEDRNKNIWVGYFEGSGIPYPGGLKRYNRDGLVTFTAFDSGYGGGSGPGKKNGICALLDDTSAAGIWIATQHSGIFRFNGQTMASASSLQWITCMAHGKNDTIYAGSHAGLYIYNGTNWSNAIFYSDHHGPHDNAVYDILTDRAGHIWISTFNKGIARYDGTAWKLYDSSNSGFTDSSSNYLSMDSSGAIWISSYSGLTVYQSNTSVAIRSRKVTERVTFRSGVNGLAAHWPSFRGTMTFSVYTIQGKNVTALQYDATAGVAVIDYTNKKIRNGTYIIRCDTAEAAFRFVILK